MVQLFKVFFVDMFRLFTTSRMIALQTSIYIRFNQCVFFCISWLGKNAEAFNSND